MAQSIQPVLLAGIIGFVSFDAAVAQLIDHPESKTPQDRVERVLQAIASGEKLEGDDSHQVPALITVVEDGEHQESDLAIRALAAMKSKASPAIVAISKRLSDPNHATRSAAVDALVAIGDDAVVPLRKLLSSSTARTRASATQALSRLKRLDVVDLARLSKDSDPRVRAALANALSNLGTPGVPLAADMLLDPELAVAVEAARALKSNREDPSIAISKLTRALSRENLSSAVADALSAYGVAAQRAIPALLKAHFEEVLQFVGPREEALRHIGPPCDLDIPQLCGILTHEDAEIRIVTAKCLALLGLNGKPASDVLEAAADKSIKEYMGLKRSPKSQSRERSNNSWRLLSAGEYCAAAVWDVSHDTPRFLNLIERLAIAADEPISCSRSMGLQDISADDCRLIETMLRHSNLNVQKTALKVLSAAGRRAEPLKNVLVQLAKSPNAELSQEAIEVLAAIGASAGREVAPILISKWHDRTILLGQFADAVGRLGIRSEETQAILAWGLHGMDRWTARSCADALCMTSNEPRRIARLVIDAARDGFFENRDAIGALSRLNLADDVVIPFLVAQLQNNDYWTRFDAINAISSFGEKASHTVTPLKKLLNHESAEIRLKAAKAIFLVTNNPADLEKQLEIVFADDDPRVRREAVETIGELNRSGARFARDVLAELHRSPPEYADKAIEALRAIGTEEAVAALRATAESSDWMLRSQATEALRQIRKSDGNGRP
jgi:HEAT repeat protein